jgi:glycosyltransferase involved in cell wall biosynthesis
MRVCIEAASLLLRSAGVKNYVYHWIAHLRALAGRESIMTFPALADIGELDHERSPAGWRTNLASIATVQFLNLFRVPWSAGGADVFHHTSLLLRTPPHRTRITATIHDMTCCLSPEVHQAATVKADKEFADRVLKRADGLIAVSANTKNDAVRILRLAPEKVSVIYPGVAERFFNVSGTEVAAARAKYGLALPYTLFVGTIEPRKNVDALLDAWSGLGESLRQEFELVVVGPAGWGSPATLDRLRAAPAGVRYLGYVPEADLPGLTAGASAFVYPSLYEGFGFPVAQAMAAGAPVITSNISSLPEVTAGAALLVNPRSREDLRFAIRKLLECPDTARELAAAGRKQAANYRWEICARRSLEFFKRVAMQ